VEAERSSVEAVVFTVILAELFHKELLGTVSFLGLGRVVVFFPQIGNLVGALPKVL
jgi:hypothetical protein